jgi:[phosphatase 2A protein]-leucine-carboxy methyltransferase
LYDQNRLPHRYVEVDFSRIVGQKCRIIKSKKALSEKVQLKPAAAALNKPPQQQQQPSGGNMFALPSLPGPPSNELHATNFHIVSADLRNVKEIEKKLLNDCDLSVDLPTLIVCECVLVYMTVEHSSNLLKFFTKHFSKCCLVSYEQTNLSDHFGEIMLENMEVRSCKLLGVDACKSNETQLKRLLDCGFDPSMCQVLTMTDFYKNKMNASERARIESIEFLDESELLMQLMDHYCVCVAANNECLQYIEY